MKERTTLVRHGLLAGIAVAAVGSAFDIAHAGGARDSRFPRAQVRAEESIRDMPGSVRLAAQQGLPAAPSRGDARLVGRWRFQKYGPIRGEFEFLSDGTYRYFVEQGRLRLAHEGRYSMRQPNRPVNLPGLVGIVELTPQRITTPNSPSGLMIDSTMMDNEKPREYFVQDNLAPQYTNGIQTLSLCDTARDWPGCTQTTRLYRNDAP